MVTNRFMGFHFWRFCTFYSIQNGNCPSYCIISALWVQSSQLLHSILQLLLWAQSSQVLHSILQLRIDIPVDKCMVKLSKQGLVLLPCGLLICKGRLCICILPFCLSMTRIVGRIAGTIMTNGRSH